MSEQAPLSHNSHDSQPNLEEQRMATFEHVAAFAAAPERQFAAGPDIQKATGLGYAEVVALGYNNYGELENDAISWKSEKNIADARVAERDERMRQGAGQAKLWQDDREAYRLGREKADKAVEGIATAAIESVIQDVAGRKEAKLNFKDRINGLGEIGERRNPVEAARLQVAVAQKARSQAEAFVNERINDNSEISSQLRDAAIESAAEAGFSTGHLRPSHYEVTRNLSAEKRTSELAQALKAHDAEMLTALSLRKQSDKMKSPDAAPNPKPAENNDDHQEPNAEPNDQPDIEGRARRTWNRGKKIVGQLGRFMGRGLRAQGQTMSGTPGNPESYEQEETQETQELKASPNTVQSTARRQRARKSLEKIEGLNLIDDVAESDEEPPHGKFQATARRSSSQVAPTAQTKKSKAVASTDKFTEPAQTAAPKKYSGMIKAIKRHYWEETLEDQNVGVDVQVPEDLVNANDLESWYKTAGRIEEEAEEEINRRRRAGLAQARRRRGA